MTDLQEFLDTVKTSVLAIRAHAGDSYDESLWQTEIRLCIQQTWMRLYSNDPLPRREVDRVYAMLAPQLGAPPKKAGGTKKTDGATRAASRATTVKRKRQGV